MNKNKIETFVKCGDRTALNQSNNTCDLQLLSPAEWRTIVPCPTIISIISQQRFHFRPDSKLLQMAVFGFNLTLSLLGVFFLRKLIPVLDLPSRFLTGFYRFYAPSETECREAANKPEKIVKDKKNKNVEQKAFIIPKVEPNNFKSNVKIKYSYLEC